MNKKPLLKHYRENKMFFLWDIVALVLIVAAVVVSIVMITADTSDGDYVEIYHKGRLLQTHSLSQNKVIEINEDGYNRVVISNGQVYISHADCPDKICIKSPAIKYSGQRIICAPNKIVVIIRGGDIDGISGGA